MYEQAAAKESARISGAIKQEEQQIEALTARYSQAAEIAQAANEASLASPPGYNDKGEMISGAAEFEMASRSMAQAKSAWNDLARRTGMEIKDVPVDYEPTANLIISSLRKDQKGTLRLLIKEAQSGKISGKARTTINNLTKNVSGADNKKGVQDALIEKLKTMDTAQYKEGFSKEYGKEGWGRAAAAEILGFLPEVAQDIANVPAAIAGGARTFWTGAPFELPYNIYETIGGVEDWRQTFGMTPRGPTTQAEAEKLYGPGAVYGGSRKPHTFMGGLISAADAEARAKQRQGSSGQ
jgi:hypothetical protein